MHNIEVKQVIREFIITITSSYFLGKNVWPTQKLEKVLPKRG